MSRKRFALIAAVLSTVAASGAFATQSLGSLTRVRPAGTAPGRPGAQSYLDVARKDCFGTARNNKSKVWFTVANGVLSDVFSPTLENSNVNTVQYIVTDGQTFTALQERDMTYSVSSPDPSGMVCRVRSVDRRHHFELISEYLTDPARSSVLIGTELAPLGKPTPGLRNLRIYVRYDATIDNTGGGGKTNQGANNAFVAWPSTALVSSDTRRPKGPFAARVVGALAGNLRFVAESSGFVGTPSDGLRQLERYHRLVHLYRAANDGNVVQTALVDAGVGQPFVLALGFAPTAGAAVRVASRSATGRFVRTLDSYVRGWRSYDSFLNAPPSRLPGYTKAQNRKMRRTYLLSANVLRADEDKTYLGAFVASPTDPFGQSVPATTTDPGWTYREVFARDSYEIFTGLLDDGDRATARQMVEYLFDRVQQPDGSFPRDSELNGSVAPDNFGLRELDQDAYPLLMAWEAGFTGDVSLYQQHIRPAADFIVDHGPAFGVDRWEEHPGYSPSTIAAEVAGLTAASRLANAAGDPARAQLYIATADFYQRHVKLWTVTTSGQYPPHRYFIRLSVNANPNTAETYSLGNGSFANVDQRLVLDPGFLELTRLGELPASDQDVQTSLGLVDSVLGKPTPSGAGWHRYGVGASGATDGYGDCYTPDPTNCSPNGAPWYPHTVGSGHLWPLLAGERAEYDLQIGQTKAAAALAQTMRRMSWGLGYIPEQVWGDPPSPPARYGSNPRRASIGLADGRAAGSATPRIWAQAQYLRLLSDVASGTVLDTPSITVGRYLQTGPPSPIPLAITSTQPGATGSAGSTAVNGTTSPGARVVLSTAQPGDPSNATAVVTTIANSQGNFSAAVPTPAGRIVLTATAVLGSHTSAWIQGSLLRS